LRLVAAVREPPTAGPAVGLSIIGHHLHLSRATFPLAAAVLLTTLDGGGFARRSQLILIVLAGIALLAVAVFEPAQLRTFGRSPMVWVLGALGGLALASAAWTIGPVADTLRQGLVILAYAAIALAAGAVVSTSGPLPVAVGLAGLAGVEALLGLGAAALHSLPDAERIGGSWRPGGSFQYPPALALLQVAALPVLLRGLAAPARTAGFAAFGTALAGAVLGCAESRLELVLAAAVIALALWRPIPPATRAETVAAAGVVLIAGLAGHLILGRRVPPSASGSAARLVVILGVCAALALAWVPLRTRIRDRVRLSATVAAVAGGAVVLCAVLAVVTTTGSEGSAHHTGLTHGRGRQWHAALDTWLDRPVAGAGAGAYYQASLQHQGESPSLFAHNLPLELAAELGIGGLMLGLGLYAAAAVAMIRARGTKALWLFGPAVAAFLIANLVDWPWHLAGLGAIWATAVGALIAGQGRSAHGLSRDHALAVGGIDQRRRDAAR
jgi:hypothetical protein